MAIVPVIVKVTHHQRGAGFSTTPEIRSVSQLKLRLFNTSGTRARGRSTVIAASPLILSGAVGAAAMFKLPIANCQLPIHKTNPRHRLQDEQSTRATSASYFVLGAGH